MFQWQICKQCTSLHNFTFPPFWFRTECYSFVLKSTLNQNFSPQPKTLRLRVSCSTDLAPNLAPERQSKVQSHHPISVSDREVSGQCHSTTTWPERSTVIGQHLISCRIMIGLHPLWHWTATTLIGLHPVLTLESDSHDWIMRLDFGWSSWAKYGSSQAEKMLISLRAIAHGLLCHYVKSVMGQ